MTSCSLSHQPVGNFFNLRHFLGCSSSHIIANQFLAALANSVVSRGILIPNGKHFLEPMFAIAGVHSFVSPIEVHVVLAERITVAAKELRASRLVANILGFE